MDNDTLKPSDIVDEVREVLEKANKGKGRRYTHYLTAYQILDRLPSELRQRLIAEHSLPGKGAGVHHAAASVVRNAIRRLGNEVEVEYFDNKGVSFHVDAQPIVAGNPVCGLYRLRREGPTDWHEEPADY